MIDISVRNLTKFFVIGENLLDGLSFEVQEGECVAILGKNGCGKTTQTELVCKRLAEDGIDFKKIKLPDYESDSSILVRKYLAGDFGKNAGDVNAYATLGGHLGASVGRNANRIGNAKFTLNGKKYQLGVNHFKNNLHSGPDGFEKIRKEPGGSPIRCASGRASDTGDGGCPHNSTPQERPGFRAGFCPDG